MRIGVLTYHRSINYGSVLQAWATQHLLSQKGYDVEIIDYIPEHYNKLYSIYGSTKTLKGFIKRTLLAPLRIWQRNNFARFRNKNLNLSDRVYTKDTDLKVLEEEYNCIICGSDQIWNIRTLDSDDIFFLPDVKLKKIAFAVSINKTDFTEERCTEQLREWMNDFDHISCRERGGAVRLGCFLDGRRDIDVLLDPTLLHHKEDYYEICSERIIHSDYIFLYKVWPGEDSIHIIKHMQDRLKLPVYTLLLVKDIMSLVRIEKEGIKIIKVRTRPENYVSLIRYASYVITDSFHGTAFSIIFEKPLICINERRGDGNLRNDERIREILGLLGIDGHYLTYSDLAEPGFMPSEIDYTIVTAKRLELARRTIDKLMEYIDH